MSNRVDLRITDKLLRLITTPKRIKIVVGGRGSSKSIGVGDIMLMFADQGERICATREFQNSVDDSVHENLKEAILRLNLGGFNTQASKITTATGGEIFYKGLARNITSIKSIGNVKRLWIEEGESISANSLKVLTPSIRSTASSNNAEDDPPEIWITMNRASKKDAIAKKYLSRAEAQLKKTGFYEDDLLMVVQLNWTDNPWFPPELQQERLDDLANLSRAEYRHIWEGDYYDEVANAIIPVEWFDAALDAHIKLGFEPRGFKVTAHDPSDGGDNKGICARHGSVFTRIGEIETADVNDGFDEAGNEAIANHSDYFVWDGGGMGVSLRRQGATLFRGKQIQYEMFNGGAAVEDPTEIYQQAGDANEKTRPKTNKETFVNLRAQKAWQLRDRFYKTWLAVERDKYFDPDELVSIDTQGCNVDDVRAEVCRMPRKMRSDGMIQLVSKVDLKNKPYEMPSPGMFDSMMMAEIKVDMFQQENVNVQVSNSSGWT
jgi:phage terminase large subunit